MMSQRATTGLASHSNTSIATTSAVQPALRKPLSVAVSTRSSRSSSVTFTPGQFAARRCARRSIIEPSPAPSSRMLCGREFRVAPSSARVAMDSVPIAR